MVAKSAVEEAFPYNDGGVCGIVPCLAFANWRLPEPCDLRLLDGADGIGVGVAIGRDANGQDNIWFLNVWLNVKVDPFALGGFDGDDFSFYVVVLLYAPVDFGMNGYWLRFSMISEVGEGTSK